MSRFWSNISSDFKMTSGSTTIQQGSVVLAETFERHWDQLKGITNNVRLLKYFRLQSTCLDMKEIQV